MIITVSEREYRASRRWAVVAVLALVFNVVVFPSTPIDQVWAFLAGCFLAGKWTTFWTYLSEPEAHNE